MKIIFNFLSRHLAFYFYSIVCNTLLTVYIFRSSQIKLIKINKKTHIKVKSMSNPYEIQYQQALDPNTREAFWSKHAEKVDWYRKPTQILTEAPPNNSLWFKDGLLNMCYNCIDRHLVDCGSSLALIYESPVTKRSKVYTYT